MWTCGRWAHHQADQGIAAGQDREFLQHAWHRVAVQDISLQARVELRPCGVDPPALVVPLRVVGYTGDGPVEARRHQSALAGPEPRRAKRGAPLSEPSGLWQGRPRFPGEPAGPW